LPRYRVIKPYDSPYPNSLCFNKGESVTIGKEFSDDPDWSGWVWCAGSQDQQAWMPKQFLEISTSSGICLKDYDARELNLEIGELLEISEIVNGFGWAKNIRGKWGWAPLNHLELID